MEHRSITRKLRDCGVVHGKLQELELITWPVIINGFGICYMLNVCVCSPSSQPSSRD